MLVLRHLLQNRSVEDILTGALDDTQADEHGRLGVPYAAEILFEVEAMVLHFFGMEIVP